MIKDVQCSSATIEERKDILSIFGQSFVSSDPEAHIESYLRSVECVLIYYHLGNASAFLFYQKKCTNGFQVLHFSLSGKTDKSPRGVQRKLGSYLYFRYLFQWTKLFTTSALCTVSNNPRSYLNMRAIAPRIFPDILNPTKSFPNRALYRKTAENLNLNNLQDNGLIPGRCQNLGFRIRNDQTSLQSLDSRGLKIMEYLNSDADNGVFVMVCVRPWIDIPLTVINQLRKSILKFLRINPKHHYQSPA